MSANNGNLDDSNRDGTIRVIREATKYGTDDMLADKSRRHYEQCYEEFVKWENRREITSVSEETMIVYFTELSKRFKPTSIWSKYSMLKSTIMSHRNLNIGLYSKLSEFLKKNSKGYTSPKCKTLESEDVQKFLLEAPDHRYLAIKVALIFGIAGACRRDELRNITVHDIEHHNNMIVVKIPRSRNDVPRKFTIDGEYYEIFKKYEALRPKRTVTDQFFLCLRDGKCTQQVIGINNFGAMPKMIAEYLGLADPEQYTGRSFRRTSATMLADVGADITTLKRNGRWKKNKLAKKKKIYQQVRVHGTEETSKTEAEQNNDCDSGDHSDESSDGAESPIHIDTILENLPPSKKLDVSNLTEINFDPMWDVLEIQNTEENNINGTQRPDEISVRRRKSTNVDNGESIDNVVEKRTRAATSVDRSHAVWVKEEHGIDICEDIPGNPINSEVDALNRENPIDHAVWTIKAAKREHELKLRILNTELERAELQKKAANNEFLRSETKKKLMEAQAAEYHNRLGMSGQPGSGAGQGGGGGGSIRSAGGSFGKMEAAHEDQYFYNKQKEQLEHLREELHDEISFHEEQIKRHQEAINRHKERIGKMPSE